MTLQVPADAPDSFWHEQAEWLSSQSDRMKIGAVVIGGHGNANAVGSWSSATIKRPGLSRFLAELGKTRPKLVTIKACYTASGGGVFIQNLADAIGAPVEAQDGLYAIIGTGNWFTAFPGGEGAIRSV